MFDRPPPNLPPLGDGLMGLTEAYLFSVKQVQSSYFGDGFMAVI